MARKKSADTLDAEIAKVKSDMSKLQDRYDRLAEKLKDLQEQKRRIEADAIMDAYLKKRRIEADAIMDAYLKSGKTLDEIMTFLKP